MNNKYKLLPALLLAGASQASVAASGYFQTPFVSVTNDASVTDVCVDIVAFGEETISYPVDLTFIAQDTVDATITNTSPLNLNVIDSSSNHCISMDLLSDFGASDAVSVTVSSVSEGISFTSDASLLITRLASGEAIQPVLGVAASQNNVTTRRFITDQGTITFTASDLASSSSSFVYSWVVTNSSGETVQTDTDGNNLFVLDPEQLPAGTYKVLVSATVSDLSQNLNINAVTMAFVINTPSDGLVLQADADLDGVADDLEGGAPANHVVNGSDVVLQTMHGLTAKLGELSIHSSSSDPVVTYDEFGSWVGANVPNPNSVDQVVNFTIDNIAVPGAQVLTVVKLDQPVTSSKLFYKYNSINNQWQFFSTDNGDAFYSAQSVNGECPEASVDLYSPAIVSGRDCLLLKITDGGANDSDRLANGSISDPGGVGAVPSLDGTTTPPSVDNGDVVPKMKAGSFSYWMIALSLLILARRVKSRK